MKKVLTIVTIFCFCFSLMAAEGEADPEVEKEQKPYWTAVNLAWGPFFFDGRSFLFNAVSHTLFSRQGGRCGRSC